MAMVARDNSTRHERDIISAYDDDRGRIAVNGSGQMNLRRRLFGFALAIFLLAVIVAALALVAPWPPPNAPQCPPQSQLLQWLGCTAAGHETLVAGLIAAGGALFGAWLAFSGLEEQIALARHTEILARQVEFQKRFNDAARDLQTMKSARGFIDAVIEGFPRLEDPGVPKGAFASRLLELRGTGRLQISENAIRAPDGNGESLQTTMARLNALADNLFAETRGASSEIIGMRCIFRDPDVIEQVDALKRLAEILESKTPRYERQLEEAAAKITASP
jgi:hypothetical protein